MDPATLAAGAIALLTAYLAKAGAEFAGEGGKAAWRLAGRLLDRLRSAVKDTPRERKALEDFSSEPRGSATATQEMLQSVFEKDHALAGEVDHFLQEVKRLGPSVSVVQRIKEAEDVVGVKARRIRSGSVEANQEVERGKNITGVQIEDDIGY
jgi:hypothetical protein